MSVTQPIIHQPNGYEKAVAELRRIADILETLPPGFEPNHVGIDILPKDDSTAVDAVAVALLGKPGATKEMSNGSFHHSAAGAWSDPVRISVFQEVPAPVETAPELHYLKPGTGDGDLSDVLACGLTVATSGSGYVEDEARVTCRACRAAAQLDHSPECREQLEERPCRFDCEARS